MTRKSAAKASSVDAFEPYLLRNPASANPATSLMLVAAPTFCGVRVVEFAILPVDHIGVRDRTIMVWRLPPYKRDDNTPLQSAIAGLKEKMLQTGATPAAVDLVGALSPFSEKELSIMADKLKTKEGGKAAKAAKPAKAEKAKRGGNPEALEKAREAREGKRAESHARKIKQLVKAKDSGLRGGRLAKLQAIESEKPKTVGDILGHVCKDEAGKEHTIDMGSLNGMVAREHIELS